MSRALLHETADDVRHFLDEKSRVMGLIESQSAELIETVESYISLREIGRRTGLSPTYLSQCRNGVNALSPGAFIKVAYVLRRLEESQ